jgi:hypothetical protein
VTRLGRGCAAVLVAGVLAATAAGCAKTPADPPLIEPATTTAAAHQDSRITLPVTVDVAFHHPNLSNHAEYVVLFTVQQAMRSMVQAEYSNDGQDAELAQYWTGDGLTAVQTQIREWTGHQQQPVGMIVLENTTYTPAAGNQPAKVGFCADWSHVVRGESRTHVVGSTVQSKGIHAAYEELGVARGADHHWRVESLSITPNSPKCP